jgi:hypothetical protein
MQFAKGRMQSGCPFCILPFTFLIRGAKRNFDACFSTLITLIFVIFYDKQPPPAASINHKNHKNQRQKKIS